MSELFKYFVWSCLKQVFWISLILILPPTPSFSATHYRFDRMWPTLPQPWYFNNPRDVTTDELGNVYVADTGNHRIQKFTSDGQFVTRWGSYGSGKGQFDFPSSIAADKRGYIFVADYNNHRVQKFTSNGIFVAQWGRERDDTGRFTFPSQVECDDLGFVYVLQAGSHVCKYTSAGKVLWKWSPAAEDWKNISQIAIENESILVGSYKSLGQVSWCIDTLSTKGQWLNKWSPSKESSLIRNFSLGAVDACGNRYLTSSRFIYKFGPDWDFIAKWEGHKSVHWNNDYLGGMSFDGKESIYVSDSLNNCIHKFTTSGIAMDKWESMGSEVGLFREPVGINFCDNSIFVADTQNHRIQRFDAKGRFICMWGEQGAEGGQLLNPNDVATDRQGYVYVADWGNHRIQKFTEDGRFIATWGGKGETDGELLYPQGVTSDGSYIYVTDIYDIHKFDTEGNFVKKWPFDESYLKDSPYGIVSDEKGSVYVTSMDRIRKFTDDGKLIFDWTIDRETNGKPVKLCHIEVDEDDNIYVPDGWGNRVLVFGSDGNSKKKWGGTGTGAGLFNSPSGVAVNPDGGVFVSDTGNHRIQVFKPVEVLSNQKAVIVAGGRRGAYDPLWSSTQMCANLAYRALTYQGYTTNRIRYLSSDLDLDLNDDGESGDVVNATKENLQSALTDWAKDADSLTVYMVDHGGIDTFLINETETISSKELDTWLDTVQQVIPGRVTVVYDACYSGSFMNDLLPPEGKERIVVTSTLQDEEAYFVTQGSISFSNFFWTHIFNGRSLSEAFELTQDAIGYSERTQHPLMDTNGNGLGNEDEDLAVVRKIYIGNGTEMLGDMPSIEAVSEEQTLYDSTSGTLTAAGVSDSDGIARVWAVIRPPDYRQRASSVLDLPSIEMNATEGGNYTGTYNGFFCEGTYYIAIYAKDSLGNIAPPKLTKVHVKSPMRRRAVLIIGKSKHVSSAIENNARLAYEALRSQGYTDNEIYFLSPASFMKGVDGLPTLSNVKYAVKTWAGTNTQDLVVYITGEGKNGKMVLSEGEKLSAAQLDRWLDALQDSLPGKVTVVYDACRSGTFLGLLCPPEGRERILLSSANENQAAAFASEGDVSFSGFFWRRVLNGASVYDAFIHAGKAIDFSSHTQDPQLDDNGNGIGNERPGDGLVASHYRIGVGIMLATDDPLIGNSLSDHTIFQDNINLWVDNVTTTGGMKKVWAIITPPGTDRSKNQAISDVIAVELLSSGEKEYTREYNGFDVLGTYDVAFYAMDEKGNVSLPKKIQVNRKCAPDVYEVDDTMAMARSIVVDSPASQRHHFHDAGDEDWIRFPCMAGKTYTVNATGFGNACDVVLSLYNSKGVLLEEVDDQFPGSGMDEWIDWRCEVTGVYYVQFRSLDAKVFGDDTVYYVNVHRPIGPLSGDISGTITDENGDGIASAHIVTSLGDYAISLSDGSYLIFGHKAGAFTMSVNAIGYDPAIKEVLLAEGGYLTQDFQLDTNNSDTDEDGMPDYWEEKFGTDRFVNDAAEDPDEDGMNNIEEFDAAGNPNNKRPEPPQLLLPEHEEPKVSLAAHFFTEDFDDSEEDVHIATEWEIRFVAGEDLDSENLGDETTGDTVFSVKSHVFLTSFAVPDFLLENRRSYEWRVRFFDHGGVSDWSEFRRFSTSDEDLFLDTDDNNIPDDQDVTDRNLDMDSDGTADIYQDNHIWCLNGASDYGPIGLKFDDGIRVCRIKTEGCDVLSETGDVPSHMPFGAISFKLTVPNPGDTANVTVYLSEDPPEEGQWFKFDPRCGWRIYPYASFREGNRRIVNLVLKDGNMEYGDADGVKNSVIIDPSGLGVAAASSNPTTSVSYKDDHTSSTGTGGGGGGCFIQTSGYKSFLWH